MLLAEIEWVTNNGPSARFQPVGQVPVRLPDSSPSARGATAATVPEFSAKWRRSPAFLAQVPGIPGAGPQVVWRRSEKKLGTCAVGKRGR